MNCALPGDQANPEPMLRRDPLTRRVVIVAPGRSQRPNEFADRARAAGPARCPFCPGNEADTPPEVAAVRPAGGAADLTGWQIRVVPNLFPAVTPAPGVTPVGSFAVSAPAVGAHEVVIESPDHAGDLALLDADAFARVLIVYRDRMRTLSARPHARAVVLFRNRGAAAGASLAHPHAQIITLPQVPETLALELAEAVAHYHREGRCLYCDLLDRETRSPGRLVEDRDGHVAVAAFAPRTPAELLVLPRRHASRFTDVPDADLEALARFLGPLLGRLRARLNDPAYNLILHQAAELGEDPSFHWHIEILPRLVPFGGFEWGTGCYITGLAPEAAASLLAAESHASLGSAAE